MKKNEVKIDREDLGLLLICAIRYCHGRETYMPGVIQSIGRKYMKEVAYKELKVLEDDCVFQAHMNLYGDEKIDKPGWLRWREDVIAERVRRNERIN